MNVFWIVAIDVNSYENVAKIKQKNTKRNKKVDFNVDIFGGKFEESLQIPKLFGKNDDMSGFSGEYNRYVSYIESYNEFGWF
jgi:hypothetical protein